MAKPKDVDPTALQRDSPGSYRTGDGRFTVEQASGRWMVVDAGQHDELGLPLVRGPFGTLAEARAAIDSARSGPAPASDLAKRRASAPPKREAPQPKRADVPTHGTEKTLPVELRRYERGDGRALRAFWASIGFGSSGDDDESLDRLAERNPGLLLVATQGDRIVGTALGAWDGRRGWLYHVGTAPDHRRGGLGRRLVREVERKLRQLGCPTVNTIVPTGQRDAEAFWQALGYASPTTRHFSREL